MNTRRRTFAITFCAMLAALSLILLLAASFLPSGRLALAAVAGFLPAAAVLSAGGLRAGLACYIVTAALALLLLPDKFAALAYVILFGHYAVVKSLLERIPQPILIWVCKLVLCNLLFALLIRLFGAVFLDNLPERLRMIPLLHLFGSIAFVIYDIVFSMLIRFYQQRIGPHLRR